MWVAEPNIPMTPDCDLYLAASARMLHAEQVFTIPIWKPATKRGARVSWKTQRIALLGYLHESDPRSHWEVKRQIKGWCLRAERLVSAGPWLTPDWITREALQILKNNLAVVRADP